MFVRFRGGFLGTCGSAATAALSTLTGVGLNSGFSCGGIAPALSEPDAAEAAASEDDDDEALVLGDLGGIEPALLLSLLSAPGGSSGCV